MEPKAKREIREVFPERQGRKVKRATVEAVVIVTQQKETLVQWVLRDLLAPPALRVPLATMERSEILE